MFALLDPLVDSMLTLSVSLSEGMRRYLKETVDKCCKQGFVETISGRRRYLPSITNTNPYIRAHVSIQHPCMTIIL